MELLLLIIIGILFPPAWFVIIPLLILGLFTAGTRR